MGTRPNTHMHTHMYVHAQCSDTLTVDQMIIVQKTSSDMRNLPCLIFLKDLTTKKDFLCT